MKSIFNYSIKSIILFLFTFFLIIFEIFPISTYLDEIVAVLSILGLIYIFIKGNIKKYDKISLVLLAVFLLIGFFGNLFSGVSRPVMSIFLDAFDNIKVFVIFYYFYYSFKSVKIRNEFIALAKFPAILFICVSTVCSLISIFINIGMSYGTRFGINAFTFIFEMQHQYTAVCVLCLCIVSISNISFKKIFIILALIPILLTTKGPSILFVVFFLILMFIFSKKFKFNIWTIIIFFILTILIGSFQIENYLQNQDAPRYLFFKYAFIDANAHLPFGSGFATFGSDMAAKYYSPLYIQYGFNSLYGMSEANKAFLNDTGLPMYIGQCGYIGTAVFLYFYYRIFNFYNKNIKNYLIKALSLTILIVFLIHSVGAAILTNSSCVIAFIGLSLLNEKKDFLFLDKEVLYAKQ